jgi:hypothetical protein
VTPDKGGKNEEINRSNTGRTVRTVKGGKVEHKQSGNKIIKI